MIVSGYRCNFTVITGTYKRALIAADGSPSVLNTLASGQPKAEDRPSISQIIHANIGCGAIAFPFHFIKYT